jgi:hypothetical protein
VQKNVARFGSSEAAQVSPAPGKKNGVYLMPQNLREGTVGDLDIPEEDDLLQFVGKQGVIGGLAFFDQQMVPFFNEPCSLCVDVNNHDDFPPFRGVLEDPRGKKDMTDPILKSKAATLPPSLAEGKAIFCYYDIRLSKNDGPDMIRLFPDDFLKCLKNG